MHKIVIVISYHDGKRTRIIGPFDAAVDAVTYASQHTEEWDAEYGEWDLDFEDLEVPCT